ncbi:MAG: hypothetical protein ACI4DY_09440 [Monoglobaceae bacterium]
MMNDISMNAYMENTTQYEYDGLGRSLRTTALFVGETESAKTKVGFKY